MPATPTSATTDKYLKRTKIQVEKELSKLYIKTKKQQKHYKLNAALTHTLLQGGKRIRPIMAIATYHMYATDLKQILLPACSLELIHTGSLMLDDLPSMDDASFRRGVSTSHIEYGESTTILASAGLWVKAFEILASIQHVSINELVYHTAKFVGEQGLILGQYQDLFLLDKTITIKVLQRSYELKTSALFMLAVIYGGYLGGASQADIKLLTDYARHMGVAFQIHDDIIDATHTLEQSGKDAHKDALNHKTNYVSLLGINGARKQLQSHVASAYTNLDGIKRDTHILRDLAGGLVKDLRI